MIQFTSFRELVEITFEAKPLEAESSARAATATLPTMKPTLPLPKKSIK